MGIGKENERNVFFVAIIKFSFLTQVLITFLLDKKNKNIIINSQKVRLIGTPSLILGYGDQQKKIFFVPKILIQII